MKKSILLFVFVIFTIFGSAAQGEFRAGVNGGIPIGDYGDFSSFAIAVDLGYLFEVSEEFEAGVETGYSNFFGKDGFDGFSFVPITAVGDYDVSDEINLEAGLGYAVSLESGGGGDFYWKFQAAYNLNEDSDVGLSYRSISGDGFSIDAIMVGYRVGF